MPVTDPLLQQQANLEWHKSSDARHRASTLTWGTGSLLDPFQGHHQQTTKARCSTPATQAVDVLIKSVGVPPTTVVAPATPLGAPECLGTHCPPPPSLDATRHSSSLTHINMT
jgi:hypothetical protein